jgi:hypothetical protein
MPKLLYFENVLWIKLFSMIGQRGGEGRIWGQFDLANVGPLQVNYKEKIDVAKNMFFMGWPINHINKRLELGMKEVPWGDEWWVPGGYASVNALKGVVPKQPTPPKKEEPSDEDAKKEMLKFYCEPIESEFQNKFKKVLFETRKRAIASSFSKQDWNLVISEKEILKLKQSLDQIYLMGVNSGIATVQSEIGPVDLKDTASDIMEFKESRSAFVAKSFRTLLEAVVFNLSTGENGDDKIREVFNLLSSKIGVVTKKETETSFIYGRDLALKQMRILLVPSLTWNDNMGSRVEEQK